MIILQILTLYKLSKPLRDDFDCVSVKLKYDKVDGFYAVAKAVMFKSLLNQSSISTGFRRFNIGSNDINEALHTYKKKSKTFVETFIKENTKESDKICVQREIYI